MLGLATEHTCDSRTHPEVQVLKYEILEGRCVGGALQLNQLHGAVVACGEGVGRIWVAWLLPERLKALFSPCKNFLATQPPSCCPIQSKPMPYG